REEPGVDPQSTTDTYVAMKLYLDNWRWAGVPFYLRTGKALPKRVTEVAVTFKRAPFSMFRETSATALEPNVLAMRIQPDEGIVLKFGAKVPGPDIAIRSVNMDFLYGASFDVQVSDAYERLLLDCMLGESTLFTREDEVTAQWTLIDNIIDNWEGKAVSLGQIDAQLQRLWRSAGSDWDGGRGPDVRTSVLNLIVYAHNEACANRASKAIR